jgi:hypothetical protein
MVMGRTTIWVTKFALTTGIDRLEGAEVFSDGSSVGRNGVAVDARDVHVTAVRANRRAEEMRLAKIASLKKQIAKLEKLRFANNTGDKP